MLSSNSVSRWQEEDISKALALRTLSPKAYRFLKEQWNFPLPSDATISRWVSKFDVEAGILFSVLKFLSHQASTMSEYDRLCVLSFDETAVAQEWSYDIKNDTLLGPKRSVQCAMIRGLIKPWKQLVFYDFNCAVTRNILFNIILEIEAAGFIVVAMVCDLGSTNVSLWNMLGISIANTCFTNPADSTWQTMCSLMLHTY